MAKYSPEPFEDGKIIEDLYDGEPLPEGVVESNFNTEIRKRFIREMQRWGRAHAAAKACGYVNAGPFYRWRKLLPKFSEAWAIAEHHYISILEEAAHERAVEGILEDVYFKGEVVGQKRTFSDGLLQTLLKANDRKKYGGSDDAGGGNSGGIVILPMVLPDMSAWEKQAQMMHQEQRHITIDGEAVVVQEPARITRK